VTTEGNRPGAARMSLLFWTDVLYGQMLETLEMECVQCHS